MSLLAGGVGQGEYTWPRGRDVDKESRMPTQGG